MAKKETGAPKLLLAVVAGFITCVIAIYGTCIGYTAVQLYFFYGFVILYVYLVCRTVRTISYTVAGAVSAMGICLAVKYLDEISAVLVSVVVIYVVASLTEIIVARLTRYVPNLDRIQENVAQMRPPTVPRKPDDKVVKSPKKETKKKAGRGRKKWYT